jgi:hypothetical protein
MMIVSMLSIQTLSDLDDAFDYRWMNIIMFVIGLICKFPNLLLTIIFRKRLNQVLKEFCETNHPVTTFSEKF